jgi:hypothetical protein
MPKPVAIEEPAQACREFSRDNDGGERVLDTDSGGLET